MLEMVSIWQALLVCAMILAFIAGRPAKVLMAAMVLNFSAAAFYGERFHAVMVVDLLCVAILIGRGPIEDFVALLFALMIPLYLPAIIGGWSLGTTFAIIEAITYIQYAVMGGIGGGIVNRSFRRRYRHLRDLGIDTDGRYALSPDQLVNRSQALISRIQSGVR